MIEEWKKVRDISETVGISTERMQNILSTHENVFRKISVAIAHNWQ